MKEKEIDLQRFIGAMDFAGVEPDDKFDILDEATGVEYDGDDYNAVTIYTDCGSIRIADRECYVCIDSDDRDIHLFKEKNN